jgi:histidine ammonia-lyase
VRERVPTLERDRPLSLDVNVITELIAAGEIERACAMKVN